MFLETGGTVQGIDYGNDHDNDSRFADNDNGRRKGNCEFHALETWVESGTVMSWQPICFFLLDT